MVDQASGQIGIELFGETPIDANDAGSLVNVAFHAVGGASGLAAVQMVDSATPHGESFTTLLADAQVGLVLSPGIDKVLLNLA